MLKVLIKKQLLEVFRSYFYDAKKNRMRSKGAIAGFFVFFILIMAGVLGGIFTGLALTLCGSLNAAGMGWLYFLLMGGIAVVLGAFGSVFNTYSGLYLAKDNDLLLSLPIPVRTIITARLMNVYLLGTMYSATAMLPTLIVYWVVAGITVPRVICGLTLFLIVSLIVLLLSCVLGWAVAKISQRLKNKSFVTVLVSLVFVGVYYFFYFRASGMIQNMIAHAQEYGEQIKGTAHVLYRFGCIGEGDWLAAAMFLAVTLALAALVWRLLSRTFLGIATDTGRTEKKRYVEKPVREKPLFGALLSKEFSRLTASANYMLNCCLGVLLIPALGVLILVKGHEVFSVLERVFSAMPDAPAVLVSAMVCMVASMVDPAAPSVSLEGKSLWICQSLPISSKVVLRAKEGVQLILTMVPMAFTGLCAALILPGSPALKVLMAVTPLAYAAFTATFGLLVGVKMPLMNWTDETAPIKQSGSVVIVLFGGMGVSLALGGLYLLIGSQLSGAFYLGLWTAALAVAAIIMQRWLDGKGSVIFAEL